MKKLTQQQIDCCLYVIQNEGHCTDLECSTCPLSGRFPRIYDGSCPNEYSDTINLAIQILLQNGVIT